MNPSILLTVNPSPARPKPLFFTPFLCPATPRRLSSTHICCRRRRRYKISTIRSASDQPSTSVVEPDVSGEKRELNGVQSVVKPHVFGEKRELKGVQSVVDTMSPPIRVASSALIVAAAVAAGYGLGSRFGGSQNAGLGGAVVVGAAGVGAAYALNSCVPEVAATNLHNYVVGCDNPGAVRKEDIEGIANKYGVSKQNEAFNAELCDIYCRFVSAVLPPGSEDLKGHEVGAIIKFKNSLGIDDPDAAAMHMEIGRRIFRQRLETGDRDGDMEERRAFQKLIYVSNLVFGEASGFLLPWKRVFKVTDAQVEVAVRDNAQKLYASQLQSISPDVEVSQLISLREAQLVYRLSDELAEEMFRETTRKLVEQNIAAAIRVVKSRTRVMRPVIEELDKILAFNDRLISLKNHPDASRFARGVGPVSIIGGEYDGDRKMDELKLLYRTYLSHALSGGRIEESKLAALNQLRNVFGLGRREAESVTLEVTSQAYRKRLQQAVSSGELRKADSKAAYLQNICEDLHFDPEKAVELHTEIYRGKLQKLVADKGVLSDEDVNTLEEIQIMFCIRKQTIEEIHADICGGRFQKIVWDAISSGKDYDSETRKLVKKAAFGLRLTREVAMSIARKSVISVFRIYIQRSRSAGSPNEAATELKKMILFNSLDVTALVADIKGESDDFPEPEEERTTKVEEEDQQTEDDKDTNQEEEQTEDYGEWGSLLTLQKARAKFKTTQIPPQKEITLKDELQDGEKAALYKTYLIYCLTGKTVKLGLKTVMRVQQDDREYIYLKHLGDLLGMTNKQIVDVHKSLAEQAFKREAEVILADGQITKAKIDALNQVQAKMGFPPTYAQKLIKSITTTKLSAALQTAIGQGRLNIKEIRELKENGVDVENMISESLRQNLFKKTVDDIFSSGTGEFDAEEVYEKIPKDLNIDVEKAKGVTHQLAKARLSNSILQAVSLLRQRNNSGVVKSLNDLLACDKALPATPLSWEVPEELADLFLVYLKSDPKAENLARVQYLLNISDSMAEAIRARKDQGDDETADDEFLF